MNCLQFENALPDYLEGSRTAEQQAHLNACSACSTLLSDLDAISAQAVSLRELEDPSPRVWNALEVQLRREGIIRQPSIPARANVFSRWRTAWLVPVAAALAIVVGLKLYQPSGVGDKQPIPKIALKQSTVTQPRTAPVFAPDDKDVMSTVASRPPAQVAAYRNDLDQANEFIRDAQEAVRSNPNDIYSQQLLINAYEQKQMLYHLALDETENNDEQ